MAFDLDPGPPAGLAECCEVALPAARRAEQIGLQSFPKTSGSKGIQVYVPLNVDDVDYDHGTKPLSQALARHLEAAHPKLIVSQQRKELRRGKVLIDWSQNDEHKTTVCVYSLRARERPDGLHAASLGGARGPGALVFDAADVLHRVEEHGDLFAPVVELSRSCRRCEDPRGRAAGARTGGAGRLPRPAYGASRLRFEPGPAVCSHVAVNVPPERFEEAVARARERVELVEDDVPFPPWRARAAYYFDPGREHRRAHRARAGAGGGAVPGAQRSRAARDRRGGAVEFLESELGLAHFSGDRRSFSAVGDDRGLFIVVPVGRQWLFTEEPAPDAPLE